MITKLWHKMPEETVRERTLYVLDIAPSGILIRPNRAKKIGEMI